MAFFGRLVLSAFVIASVSCTRDVTSDLNLNLSIPTSYSSMALTSKLKHVIINMRSSMTATQVSEFSMDFGENGPTGGSVNIVVPGDRVPKSSTLFIQYLGVFEGNGLQLYYGFAQNIDSTVSGDINASISATLFGTSGQFGRVSGRYLPPGAPYSGTTGPTGVVTTYFKPPTVGHPPILIERSDMYDGWFNLIALSGTPFKHDVIDIKNANALVTVFGGPVNLASFSAAASIGKIIIPSSYRQEGSDGSVRQEAENVSVFGYFANGTGTPTVTVPAVTGKYACYPVGVAQIVPRLFSDQALTQPIIYDVAATGDITKARIVGTYGTPQSNTTNCNLANMNTSALFANADWLMEGHDGPTGMAAPFAALNYKADFRSHAEHLKILVSDNSGNAQANLSWQYLPGITSQSISGAAIYMKSGSMNGGGHDDLTCDQVALREGFIFKQDVTGLTSTATVTSDLSGSLFTYHSNPSASTDIYNHSFMVCPYRLDAVTGAKKFAKNVAWSSCMGDCESRLHLGLAVPDVASPASIGGSWVQPVAQLGSITVNATDVTLSTTVSHGLQIGDEVLLRVTGYAGSGACGYHHNNEIQPNTYAFKRVTSVASASLFNISQGSFVDSLDSFNVGQIPSNCVVQAVKVPHFGYMNFNSLATIAGPYKYNLGNSVGIVAFRASGTVTFQSSGGIDVSGKGFSGGVAGGRGEGSLLLNPGGSGAPAYAGGAHASSGGDGHSGTIATTGPMAWGFNKEDLQLSMGGGAGGGVTGAAEGHGGGTIFISAAKIDNQSILNPVLNADGAQGISAGFGGGAGGSVVVHSKAITVNTLTVSANGADCFGGVGVACGGGGSGFVSVRIGQTAPTVSAANVPGSGNGTLFTSASNAAPAPLDSKYITTSPSNDY